MYVTRLETPQRTDYGVHRPKYFAHRDPAPRLHYGEEFPPMQTWEKVAWSFVVGICAGVVIFADLPW